MSANLVNSAALSGADWFNNMVRAAMVEYALQHPFDRLSRGMVRDPTFLLPVFVSVVADNPVISGDEWQGKDNSEKQNDVRYALATNWAAMSAAVPGLAPPDSRIPVLSTDPDPTSSVSVWISSDGNLKCRDDTNTVWTISADSA